jgi:ribose 5-phosphate isomerase B
MSKPILLASDHAGFELKEYLKKALTRMGVPFEDLGTHSADSVDYPDYARPVAQAVSEGRAERGILVCGSGQGMAMTANRYPRVRAALALDAEMARLAREHNDANVLALGGRLVLPHEADQIVKTWLETPFAGGRHQPRVQKIER